LEGGILISGFWVALSVAIFFIVSFMLAHLGRIHTGKGLSEYYVAGRNVGGFISALTYSATTYSAFMMVGLVGFTYAGGVGALGFELIYFMGVMLAILFGIRFYMAGRKKEYITPAQLLGAKYGSRFLQALVALICLVFLIPYMSVQLIGSAYLLETLSGGQIPYGLAVVTVGIIVAFYTFWGGMRGVAWTDAIQALIMIVAALTLLVYVVQVLVGGFNVLVLRLETEHPELLTVPGPPRGAGRWFSFSHFLGLTIPWFFFSITNPQVVQRFFIPKSIGSLKNMIRGFLVFGFTYTIIVTLLGLASKLLIPNLSKPDLAMPTLLGLVPAPLALIVMVSILAAAVSTSDSILLTLSSMATIDIYKNLKPKASEKESLKFGKIVIGIIMVLLVLFSLKPLGLIVELSVTSSAYLLQFVPATFGAFFWKKTNAKAATTSIILGCLVTGVLYFTNIKPLGLWPAIWGILINTLTFIILSLVVKPYPKPKIEGGAGDGI